MDYLIGLSDTRTVNDSGKHGFFFFFDDKDIFIQRLTAAIADAGLSEENFKASVPIGYENAAAILEEEQEPTAKDLIEISQFLNVSIDYLLVHHKLNT